MSLSRAVTGAGGGQSRVKRLPEGARRRADANPREPDVHATATGQCILQTETRRKRSGRSRRAGTRCRSSPSASVTSAQRDRRDPHHVSHNTHSPQPKHSGAQTRTYAIPHRFVSFLDVGRTVGSVSEAGIATFRPHGVLQAPIDLEPDGVFTPGGNSAHNRNSWIRRTAPGCKHCQ